MNKINKESKNKQTVVPFDIQAYVQQLLKQSATGSRLMIYIEQMGKLH